MVSNALSSASVGGATTAPATHPILGPEPLGPIMAALFAIGFCVLMVWAVRRAIRPDKLRLTDAPGRPSRLTVFGVLASLLAWALSAAGAGALAGLWYPPSSPQAVALTGLGTTLVWLAASLVVASLSFQHGLGHGLGLTGRHWLFDGIRGVVGFLAIMPVCLGLFVLARSIVPQQYQPLHELLDALREAPTGWKVLLGVVAVILAPIAEEVFFRGLLQTMFRRYLHNPWLAIAATSVIFALVHVPYWHTMPALAALSVALGYNYERCGRLLAPVLIHVLFNAVNLWVFLSQ